ncbi:glycerol-3-phosphate dehydrogenase [Parvularcula maris]|uniref:Glycerol-3-phosphate dehydrogenase n=1 Tax=Parvularcula maris TaxID=2965077 RepID=A0A9X2LB39_9PROT|nr:glycerol-3-phosphate dehydrogenase [Parvularcula maris]MCQ8186456.1 glycerol-3-phosphate dehydrogenase [Parvularcula maris]
MTDLYDLVVVGGGINGAGIARDAAGRGLSVYLCERDDLASHTSSWSSKLIHGGLRYLEHKEFRLVRESLIEREVLLQAAPHLIRPLRFVLPYHKGLRPAWMLRTGLFLYDHLGGRKLLPPTKTLNLSNSPYGAPLKDSFTKGFEYSDCFADDARLVAVNAMDARAKGADIHTRTRMTAGRRAEGVWQLTMQPESGAPYEVRARAVVNAAGPWVTDLFDGLAPLKPRKKIRLVKGSHIVVTPRFADDRAYILQSADNRIIFAIPYLNGATLIGTTDVAYQGDPAEVAISDDETDYLLALANEYFAAPCTRDDILSTYSGVRPLYDDLSREDVSTVTRDYAFDIDDADGGAPLLSVYGGKLTTYRKLAEHALAELSSFLPHAGAPWTSSASLPGGEVRFEDFPAFRDEMSARYAFMKAPNLDRLISAYGTMLPDILRDASSLEGLGEHLGCGLYEAELDHLRRSEFVTRADDVLFRRTKLGLQDTDGKLRAKLSQRFASQNEGVDA